MKNKIGSTLTYLSQLGVFMFGLAYFLRSEYMPYHAEGAGMAWDELTYNMQRLIWTLMKAASGGWLALGVVFTFLQYKFNQTKALWIANIILIGGLIFGVIAFYAAMGFRMTTEASAPVLPVIIILCVMVIGYFFNRKYAKS